ncbi:MAG TPA: hypothetical protein VFL28_13325 [bacterium]|nr:hypothetical protein [bacterium]
MDGALEALRRDLARFERRTRMFWLAGFVAAVIVAVLWGGARQAQSQAAALRVRELDVVDQSNHPRIVLGLDAGNRPGIGINDDAGKTRVRVGLGVQPASPLVFLADAAGRPRLFAGSNVEHGDSQFTLSDAAGAARTYFGFGAQLRTPQMALNDDRGKDRIYAGWTTAGAAAFYLLDDAGNITWRSGPGTPAKPAAP